MNYRAVGRKLIVRPLKPKDTSDGGIMLAPQYAQPSGRAVVVSAGGRVTEPDLKPGTVVTYSWINGVELQPGVPERVLDFGDVLTMEGT